MDMDMHISYTSPRHAISDMDSMPQKVMTDAYRKVWLTTTYTKWPQSNGGYLPKYGWIIYRIHLEELSPGLGIYLSPMNALPPSSTSSTWPAAVCQPLNASRAEMPRAVSTRSSWAYCFCFGKRYFGHWILGLYGWGIGCFPGYNLRYYSSNPRHAHWGGGHFGVYLGYRAVFALLLGSEKAYFLRKEGRKTPCL